MKSSWLVIGLLACAGGCDKKGGPADAFVSYDLSDPCRSSFPPARCRPDLAMPPALDMTMLPAMINVTGDNASGYTGATLSSFLCMTDPSAGPFIQINPFPDKFPAGNPVHGVTPLTLNIYSDGIQIIGGNIGTIYYENTPGSMTFPTSSKTGSFTNVTLKGVSGAPGNLTVSGGWKCP